MPAVMVLQPDGSMTSLKPAPFAEEAHFQELLAKHHDLLDGDDMDPAAPRRWLLVDREVGVPDAAEAADRWSIDHLFIDQDAIPTFVEVKRASDTRTRREVVAQMLDYAANGTTYWPIETIRSAFEERCALEGKEPQAELTELLGAAPDPEAFWQSVKTNLHAGRVRLLFVADEIPEELRRIVEFLNQQMEPAEVLAVEIRQFEGNGLRTLVPRLIGQTVVARDRKSAGRSDRGKPWDEESFFAKLAERGDASEAAVCRQIFDWCRTHLEGMDYGRGTKMASFIPFQEFGHGWFSPLRVYTGYAGAYVEIPLGQMKVPPFDEPEVRREYIGRINQIPGVAIAEDPTRFPSFPVTALRGDKAMRALFDAADWALQQVGLSRQAAGTQDVA